MFSARTLPPSPILFDLIAVEPYAVWRMPTTHTHALTIEHKLVILRLMIPRIRWITFNACKKRTNTDTRAHRIHGRQTFEYNTIRSLRVYGHQCLVGSRGMLLMIMYCCLRIQFEFGAVSVSSRFRFFFCRWNLYYNFYSILTFVNLTILNECTHTFSPICIPYESHFHVTTLNSPLLFFGRAVGWLCLFLFSFSLRQFAVSVWC